MEGQTGKVKKDWPFLILLVILVLALRGWLIWNTEVTARDSIGYIRYALDFEKMPWGEVLRKNHQHPGYPFAIWLMSGPVGYCLGGTDPYSMQLSAQLVTSLASLLLIFPMFYLGKMLFDRQVGFWSALLFQFFPVSGHHLSDGISEGLYLLFLVTGLWLAARALCGSSSLRFVLCGVFCGLAYLTRPEGTFLLAAIGLVLLAQQIGKSQRRSWLDLARCGLCLMVAAAAVASLYVAATGQVTRKPSARIIRWAGNNANPGKPIEAISSHSLSVSPSPPLLWASLFASHLNKDLPASDRLRKTLGIILAELNQGFHYLAGFPALAGLWWYRRRFREHPGWSVMLILCGLQLLVLIRLGMLEGYVSDRHLMIVVLCGTYLAVAMVHDLPGLIVRVWKRRRGGMGWPDKWEWCTPLISLALMVVFWSACVPKSLQRLHGNRAGNHEVGRWLAQHLHPGDIIVDDHSWSHYYAGQVFTEGSKAIPPMGYQPTCYVVMTRSRDAKIQKKRIQEEEKIRARHGQVVHHWPPAQDPENARVVVYALPRDPQTHPWSVRP